MSYYNNDDDNESQLSDIEDISYDTPNKELIIYMIDVNSNLEQPSANSIQQIKDLLDNNKFTKTIGSNDTATNFHEVLWLCSVIFNTSTVRNSTRSVYLFTNQSDPTQGNKALQQKCKTKMQDLEDFSITTTLYPLPPTVFTSDCFFSQLLPVSEEERITRELDVGSSIDKLKHLATDLNRKVFTKRTLLNGELKIKNVAISFNMYATLHTSTVGSAVQLDAKTNDTLRCETKFICLETGSLLEDFQMRTYYEYADQKVYISKADIQELKKIQTPGLELMGFKPMANLTVYHNVKNPSFIYPNEDEIKNSTVAFKALLEEMKRQNVFGVARLLFRAAGLVRFVALVPQVEEWNATKTFLLKNPGFNIIPLPFADEIRNVKVPSVPEVSADLVRHAKNISDILLFEGDYAPQDMSNPALQKFYRALEATALNLDFDNDAVNEEVDKFQSYFDDFTNTLNEVAPPSVAPVKKVRAPAGSKAAAAPKKRKAADASDDDEEEPKPKKAAAPRKKKVEEDDGGIQVKDEGNELDSYKKLWEQNKLGSQTVPILKDILKACGLPVSGTKAVLIEKISTHFGNM